MMTKVNVCYHCAWHLQLFFVLLLYLLCFTPFVSFVSFQQGRIRGLNTMSPLKRQEAAMARVANSMLNLVSLHVELVSDAVPVIQKYLS
jgi:hypothetical protein